MEENRYDIFFELGNLSVEGREDYQRIRISQRNRVRDIIKRKIEGIPYGKPEDKKEDKKYDEKFKDKNLPKFLKELIQDEKITDIEKEYIEELFKISKETAKIEKQYEKLMDRFLEKEKLWNSWLINIKGISSVLGSNLVKNFGYCEKYRHVSSLRKHCGFDPDGAKGRRKGELISYNPKFKTLMWKIGDSFIKQRTPVYRDIYDNEKKRQMTMLDDILNDLSKEEKKNLKKMTKRQEKRDFISSFNPKAPVSLLNADLRARRRMIQIFQEHYWVIGRKFKGLPISKPYPIDKLGHQHYIEPPFNPFKESDLIE